MISEMEDVWPAEGTDQHTDWDADFNEGKVRREASSAKFARPFHLEDTKITEPSSRIAVRFRLFRGVSSV